MTEKEEKERQEEKENNPADEGVNSSEEKEQEQFEERLSEALQMITKEMPGSDPELDEFSGSVYIWVPYVKDGADRGALVGVLYLVRENPETHTYYLKSSEEVLESIKTLKSDFVFVQSQICEAMKQWRRITNESANNLRALGGRRP